METLFVIILVVLLIRWFYLRSRLEELERRINELAAAVSAPPAGKWTVAFPAETPAAAPPPAPKPTPAPPPPPPTPVVKPVRVAAPPLPVPPPAFTAPSAAAPQRSSEEWEAQLGGNWLNKIGVLVLTIGIALALAYSYKYLGPAGRVTASLAISLTMLLSGVVTEKRERYRVFARGLIGGGWAALYFTTYAAQALEPARIIHDPWLGATLLLAVAAGMIVHSLRYQSQAVTGLAYFIAFVTLAITPITAFSLFALLPLEASLLYAAHRFRWSKMALFGMIATYVVCATRPDNGAPLWQAQAIFASYWLLFEAFDILNAEFWLMPLNAIGFLGLSVFKWETAAPHQLWAMLSVTAAAYLGGALLRGRSGHWQPPITLTSALAAVAILLKLDHQWATIALLVEAELFHLAGLRLRAGYLRIVAAGLFGVELAQLLAVEVGQAPVREWTPIAALTAAACYLNRVLRSEEVAYGFGGVALAALVAGFEAVPEYRTVAWMLLAIVPFAIGWWRRMFDFRLQSYLMASLGLTWTVWNMTPFSLSVAIAVSYGATLSTLLSSSDRFLEDERTSVRWLGSLSSSLATGALIWKVAPSDYIGLSWMAAALLLLELGLRGMPKHFRWQAYALASVGAGRTLFTMSHWWIPAIASVLAYAMAARARKDANGAVLAIASMGGSLFAMIAMAKGLPHYAVAPAWTALALALAEFDSPILQVQSYLVAIAAFAGAMSVNLVSPHRIPLLIAIAMAQYFQAWRTRQRFYLTTASILVVTLMHYDIGPTYASAGWAAFGLALCFAGRQWKVPDLRWQSYALAGMAFGRCWYVNLAGSQEPLLVASLVAASLYTTQLLSERDSQQRTYFSLLATTLASLIPYYCVASHLRTMVWGMEGVLLLGSGFPLRDRLLRISGLTLLLGCIVKLFFWDLSFLDTLPRIFSFIVLGLLLIGVSWVYTRFRERIVGYL